MSPAEETSAEASPPFRGLPPERAGGWSEGGESRPVRGGTVDPAASVTAAAAARGDSAPYAAALACLPGAGPATLVALLRDWAPEEAWRRIRAGQLTRTRPRPAGNADRLDLTFSPAGSAPVPADGSGELGPTPDRSWQDAARRLDPPGWWARHAAAGIGVTWIGHPAYPVALLDDPQPAGVLFWRGSLDHLRLPCVAIVGTRRATPDGRSVAFEMGRDLAAAGICVVSGLALGIDGAAHAGALMALQEFSREEPGRGPGAGAPIPVPPAGVAASGVDTPYPRRHALLWDQVAERGAMLSETPPGRPAQAWRFPARNRIIAAISRMVVVVESHETGGSLITADAAIARGIDVRVVPGPVRSPASAGSNQLLHDGPAPVRDARDVLDGLGIFLSNPSLPSACATSLGGRGRDAPLDPATRAVLDTVLWRPSSINQIVERSGVSVPVAARALDSLEAAGWIEHHGDWWARRPSRGSGAR